MKRDLLSLENIAFGYAPEKTVFRDLSLSCGGGDIVGILGENGAGKTTLFDIVSGGLPIDGGAIRDDMKPEQISYLQQVVTLPSALKMREVVEMVSCFQGIGRAETNARIEKYWSEAMLSRYRKIRDRRTGVCSYGEKRWLVVCAMLALGEDKKLFILDEPTAGIDVQHRFLIWELINKVRSDDRTFLISSHMVEEIEKNTDYFYFLNRRRAEKFPNMREFMRKYGADNAEDAFLNATVKS